MSRPRTDPLQRLMSRVTIDKETGCWLAGGSLNKGYAQIGLGGRNTKVLRAHRFMYERLVGPIPEGLTLDHLCGTPACVNPFHCEPVTAGENSLRGRGPAGENSRKTHCKRGHRLDTAYVFIRNGRPARQCRVCQDENMRRYKERNREKLAAKQRAYVARLRESEG